MNVLDLFSGIGGFSLGLEKTGMNTIAFCEQDPTCQQVLKKHWADVLIYTNVEELSYQDLMRDGINKIDIICGGFPCQDISSANKGQKGLDGERSGLWYQYARIIGEIRPKYALIENVSAILVRGLDRILCDLAALGYDAEWHCVPASYLGSAHNRDRFWLVAYPDGSNVEGLDIPQAFLAHQKKPCRREFARAINAALPADDYIKMRGNFDGVPGEMERLKQYGNSIVPLFAEILGRAIMVNEERKMI